MKKLIFLLTFILFSFLFYKFIINDFEKENNMLFHGGTIITMEESFPEIEGIFVKNGKIVAIGNFDHLKQFVESNTQIIDLKGKTLMPGLIDPHTHPVLSSFTHNMVDLSGFTHNSPEEVWNHLTTEVAKKEVGEWVICRGLDPILVKGLKPPSIQFLDSIGQKNPIVILAQSLHSYWANSLAFSEVGINKNTPNPSESSYYEKDPDGNLTGFIAEQLAFIPFKDALLATIGKEAIIEATVQVLKEYAAKGNTSITSLGMTTDDKNVLLLFEHLSSENSSFFNKLLAKLGVLPERVQLPRNFVFIREDAAHLLPESVENGDDAYKIVGVKLWYDGSPYTGSMYIKEPYLNSELTQKGFHIPPDFNGERLISKEDLQTKLKKYQEENWQIAIHTQGDLAIQEVLEVYESLDNSESQDFRHRLEHCLLLDSNSISKMKKLGVFPSFHINHLLFYGQALRDEIIGMERAQNILPIQQSIDSQLTTTLHADQPMFNSDPFSLIHTAVNRQTKEGDTLGVHQKINIHHALKNLTINAAWQIKMEDKIGSIKVGKYADLIVLDKNPYETPVEKLIDLRVLKTYINGNLVFENSIEK